MMRDMKGIGAYLAFALLFRPHCIQACMEFGYTVLFINCKKDMGGKEFGIGRCTWTIPLRGYRSHC